MFKNPENKLSVIVKAMFWVLSVMYALFACGFALVNTFMFLAFDAAMASASSSMNAILGSGNTYSGGGSFLFIVFNWAVALLSIIAVILILYWLSLFLLTVAEMNTELKKTRETVRNIENNIHGYSSSQEYSYSQPEPVYSQPTQQHMPFYTPSQPFYNASAYEPPKPLYEPLMQTIPKPNEIPIQKNQPIETNTQPAPNPQVAPSTPEPIKEPVVMPAENVISETPKPSESKEDLLNKYGSSGNYYRRK